MGTEQLSAKAHGITLNRLVDRARHDRSSVRHGSQVNAIPDRRLKSPGHTVML